MDADSLAEKRQAAKVAKEELRNQSSPFPKDINKAEQQVEDPDQTAKISALYGTLPTIETLSPLLPSVLERLRSLRHLHNAAAEAGQRMDNVEKKGLENESEIRRWKEALEVVEGKVEEMEGKLKGNMGVVENWVGELEGRVKELGSRS